MSVPERASQQEAHTLAELLTRARTLADGGQRRILAIVGAPGSGKSTLAARLVEELGESAVVVSMDGFHLSDRELARLGRSERKGAPDTFDVAGYVSLLRRLREDTSHIVYAPEFDRAAEMSVAGAIVVAPQVPLVVTEGNYLLLESAGWGDVGPLIDESWFLLPDDEARVGRLIQRHVDYGRSPHAARSWYEGSDRHNGDLVMQTRHRADVIVTGGFGPVDPDVRDRPSSHPEESR